MMHVNFSKRVNTLDMNIALFLFLSFMAMFSFVISAFLIFLSPYQALFAIKVMLIVGVVIFALHKLGVFHFIAKKMEWV